MTVSGSQVPMTVVTDSKDGHDRLTSDAGTGSTAQKSINQELGSIREILNRPRTSLRWTDGSNMIVDCLTKDMPADHLLETLARGSWSIELKEELVASSRRVARRQWEAKMKTIQEEKLAKSSE